MSDQQQPNPQYPPYYQQRRKSRWWIPVVIIGGVLLLFIAFIAAFFGAIGSAFSFEKETVEVKNNSVLYLTLDNVSEYAVESPFEAFGGSGSTNYYDIIRAIKNAKDDDKIVGIYYKATMTQLGFPQMVEIQEALSDFKKSGKFFYAFIETGRENEYFNALPADSIFMPREGILEMNGFGIASMFMKGFFEKIGINFTVIGFEDFKSAGESFSRNNFSDSARYQLQVILNQRYDILTKAISNHRKIEPTKLNELIARGIYSADTLKDHGFIDAYMTESQVRDFLKDKVFKDEKDSKKKKLKLVTVSSYLSVEQPKAKIASEDKQIAIIYAQGPLQDSPSDLFSSEPVISTKEFVKYIRKAREDENVKAIILRVNSPGGSVITSDAIQEEILATKKVKPIYASMSNVAASGGYYISMSCDTIIAHPSTITGSIGVILAVPNVSGLLGKLDITSDTISTGPSANMMNGMMPYTDKDKQFMYDMGKQIYDRFVEKVAKNRKMTFEQARALAKGRVWTGEDAKRIGIIDVVGDFEESLKIAKRRIGVPEDQKVLVRVFPEHEDPMNQILKAFGLGEKDPDDEEVSTNADLAKLLGVKESVLSAAIDELPDNVKPQMRYFLQLAAISKRERNLIALPYLIDIK